VVEIRPHRSQTRALNLLGETRRWHQHRPLPGKSR
jgi:hypothetical protein